VPDEVVHGMSCVPHELDCRLAFEAVHRAALPSARGRQDLSYAAWCDEAATAANEDWVEDMASSLMGGAAEPNPRTAARAGSRGDATLSSSSSSPAAAPRHAASSSRTSRASRRGRRVTARCWMARDFPLPADHLRSLLPMLTAANPALSDAVALVENIADAHRGLFPVRVVAPLAFSVSADVAFSDCTVLDIGNGRGGGREATIAAPAGYAIRMPPQDESGHGWFLGSSGGSGPAAGAGASRHAYDEEWDSALGGGAWRDLLPTRNGTPEAEDAGTEDEPSAAFSAASSSSQEL